jgi:hypothetical protein
MKFNYQGESIKIEFEETDTDSEKRMVEQGIAFIRNTLERFKEIENK